MDLVKYFESIIEIGILSNIPTLYSIYIDFLHTIALMKDNTE